MERLRAGDRSEDGDVAPRNVMNSSYWRVGHREPPEREEMLLGEILKSVIGDDGYPGDTTTSPNWPGVAPGTRGILNALSPKYCNWAGIVDLDPKPPILWTHGAQDIVVADGSPWEMGTLGSLGAVPGWPEIVRPAADGHADPRAARALRRPRRDRDLRGVRATSRRSTRASAGARGSSSFLESV